MIRQGHQTKTLDIPLDKGPQIVEAKRGEPLQDGEALHRGGAARNRLGTGGSRRRFHEAPEGGGQTVLSLSADLPNALSEPASKRFEGAVPHRPVRRFPDGRRCHRRADARRARRNSAWRRDTIVVFASDNGPDGPGARTSAATCRTSDRRTLSRRARRRERRLDPHRRHHPLAGPDKAAIILRDVLDHGFLPDLRAACGRQGAGRPADRRRRSERPAARHERERDGASIC